MILDQKLHKSLNWVGKKNKVNSIDIVVVDIIINY